jgi:hypothetical protein
MSKEKEMVSVSKAAESRREQDHEKGRKKTSVVRKLGRPVGGPSRKEQHDRSVKGPNLGSNKNQQILNS